MFEILKIHKWHKKTFPNTTHSEQMDKVISEIYEFTKEFDDFTKARSSKRRGVLYRRATSELIDVIIASINCMRYPEVREMVAVKMSINKQRTFVNNHHIPIDKHK